MLVSHSGFSSYLEHLTRSILEGLPNSEKQFPPPSISLKDICQRIKEGEYKNLLTCLRKTFNKLS